jgi:hypothetical protein
MNLVDPVVTPTAMTVTLAPKLDRIEGTHIGLWQNGKLNARELLVQVEAELRSRYDIAGVVTGTYLPGRLMRTDEWGELDTCNAVILANGD